LKDGNAGRFPLLGNGNSRRTEKYGVKGQFRAGASFLANYATLIADGGNAADENKCLCRLGNWPMMLAYAIPTVFPGTGDWIRS
jgi:hypothetical protein